MRTFLVLICLALSWTSAYAERAEFKFLKTVRVSELNDILSNQRVEFLKDIQPGPDYEMPAPAKAKNAIDLYSVRYYSSVPELDGKEILATGLLALPAASARAGKAELPLLAYLHGTVGLKSDVPSFAFRKANATTYAHDSYETRYMAALFAGSGYAVMFPDYFGLGGGSANPEAYMMKQSTAQGNYDLYLDVVKHLKEEMGISASKFLVSGWSQGGLNATGFIELLEENGVKVDAAFTAASPNDPYGALNAAAFYPRAADAPWLSMLFGLTAFSCENYLGPKGLAKAVIDPQYYDDMKKIYDRSYANPSNPTELGLILYKWGGTPYVKFLRPAYRDPVALAKSSYGQCLAAGETYRRVFKTPLRMFYGSIDEVVRPKIGLLAYDYQQTITDTPDAPSASKIKAYLVKGAGHRLTFISATVAAKAWMDRMQ